MFDGKCQIEIKDPRLRLKEKYHWKESYNMLQIRHIAHMACLQTRCRYTQYVHTHAQKHSQTASIYSHTHSLICMHSSHSTMIWSTKEPFLTHTHTLRCPGMHKYITSLFPLTCWHDTHTPDQRPCPGNLFQPICAAVRVGPIVSCVCNVSETVIGKSFETLKSLSLSLSLPLFHYAFSSLLPSHPLSISTPPSLNLLLFSPPSFHFPHTRSIFLPPSLDSFSRFLSFKDYSAVGVCGLKAASQLVLLTHLVQWSSSRSGKKAQRQRHKLSHKANTVTGFL